MIGLILLLVIFSVLFIVIRLLEPSLPAIGLFEIERRIEADDEPALKLGEQRKSAPLLFTLRTFLSLVTLQGVNIVLWILLGGVTATLITIVGAIAVEWLIRIRLFSRIGRRLYERIEPRLLTLYGYRSYFAFLPLETVYRTEAPLHSEAELLHEVDRASFLDAERRTLIRSALEFTGLNVSDAMSGRRSIKAIDKGELLGPLLLDELYKTGKQAFVVTDGDLDDVIGILKLERLTSLDMKDTPSALKAMSPEVHVIDSDAPIIDALGYLRSSRAPFLVVKDGDATVGLLTMDNILRCLFEQ